MKYVLDSSVAFKWEVRETDADKARRLREDFRAGVHELLAPDVFPVEVAHSLTKAERQGRITDAEGLWMDAMTTLPQLHPTFPLMRRALQIARHAPIGVYDCLYAALAEREGCELLTADDRLKRSLPGQSIVLIASLP